MKQNFLPKKYISAQERQLHDGFGYESSIAVDFNLNSDPMPPLIEKNVNSRFTSLK